MEIAFEINFDGQIWNTAYENKLLCLEVKNISTKETSFHILDLEQVAILASFHSPLHLFFCGLDTFSNQKIIVHGFDEHQNILTKGISVHDMSGEVLFTDKEYLFESVAGNTILMTNSEHQLYQLINNRPEVLTESITISDSTESDIRQSVHYTQENQHFDTVAAFLQQKFNLNAIKGLDYLEYGGKIMISFYISVNSSLQNLLYVLNEAGELVYQDVLDKELKGIGVDTFFVIQNRLYYIKLKNAFVGITLY